MKIKFGKHKGKTFEEVLESDPSYLIWIITNKEMLSWVHSKYPELFNFIKNNVDVLEYHAYFSERLSAQLGAGLIEY